MGRIIFWLVVFFGILLAIRLANSAAARSARDGSTPRTPKTKDTATIRCVNCGVYLPSADAVPSVRGPLCGDPRCQSTTPRDKR